MGTREREKWAGGREGGGTHEDKIERNGNRNKPGTINDLHLRAFITSQVTDVASAQTWRHAGLLLRVRLCVCLGEQRAHIPTKARRRSGVDQLETRGAKS